MGGGGADSAHTNTTIGLLIDIMYFWFDVTSENKMVTMNIVNKYPKHLST